VINKRMKREKEGPFPRGRRPSLLNEKKTKRKGGKYNEFQTIKNLQSNIALRLKPDKSEIGN